jgi:hypothetical protein
MILDALKGFWCYLMHQRRGHAVVYNLHDNTWKCVTCKHTIKKD